jgi:hypothetical protein
VTRYRERVVKHLKADLGTNRRWQSMNDMLAEEALKRVLRRPDVRNAPAIFNRVREVSNESRRCLVQRRKRVEHHLVTVLRLAKDLRPHQYRHTKPLGWRVSAQRCRLAPSDVVKASSLSCVAGLGLVDLRRNFRANGGSSRLSPTSLSDPWRGGMACGVLLQPWMSSVNSFRARSAA